MSNTLCEIIISLYNNWQYFTVCILHPNVYHYYVYDANKQICYSRNIIIFKVDTSTLDMSKLFLNFIHTITKCNMFIINKCNFLNYLNFSH